MEVHRAGRRNRERDAVEAHRRAALKIPGNADGSCSGAAIDSQRHIGRIRRSDAVGDRDIKKHRQVRGESDAWGAPRRS